MTLGIEKRYYCKNIKNRCQYALNNHIYTEKQYRINQKCIGINFDGCGEPIVPSHKDTRIFLYPLIVAFIAIAVYSSIFLYELFFPAPIQSVFFTSGLTHIDETVGRVEVTIERNSALNQPLAILYLTSDGTAKAGDDYQAENGKVVFNVNQTLVKIPVTIFPDNDFSEPEEVFSITLTNVEAQPHHQIFIKEAPPPPETLDKADIIVRDLANTAKNIADYARRSEITKKIISQKGVSLDKARLKIYANEYYKINSNLDEARDHYIEKIADLRVLDRPTVIRSMDNWINHLKQKNLVQLHDAAVVMKHHFIGYLQSGALDMEQLIIMLNETIPEPPSNSDTNNRI